MIKRICSVWLVGAIVVSAGSVVTSQSAFGEGPMATVAAVLAPAPLLAQDPECDACVENEDAQGKFWQCCLGCGDLDPENETGTNCSTPTREGCEFDDPCEPTLAFDLLRGDGTTTLEGHDPGGAAHSRSLSLRAVLVASGTGKAAPSQVLVACDGSVLGRAYDEARIAALREASSRLVL